MYVYSFSAFIMREIHKINTKFYNLKKQGCEASVLLDGSASGPGEQSSIPNLTLRQAAFVVINNLRALVQKQCGQVVSCSDILALAARDSVVLVTNYSLYQ